MDRPDIHYRLHPKHDDHMFDRIPHLAAGPKVTEHYICLFQARRRRAHYRRERLALPAQYSDLDHFVCM